MTVREEVGSVVGLWRFPVKSMRGERLTEAEIGPRGIVGDRAYALIEGETGKVVSAKSTRLYPNLFGCRASFVEPPRGEAELPPVRIELPDGSSLTSDQGDADRVLSAFFQRDVTLARSAPDDYTIDMYVPDVDGADPRRDTVVEQKLGSALFAELGVTSPVPAGSFFDAFPLTVLTTATLARLGELRPESRFDERRFRMNVIVRPRAAGFVENDWIRRTLLVGDDVRIRVRVADSRCVMTTLAQEDLSRDPEVLKTLVRHNSLEIGKARYPCAGVYAIVEAPGTVGLDSPLALLPAL